MNAVYLKISVVSNIIFEPHFAQMVKRYFGSDVTIYSIPYGEYNDKEYQNMLAESDVIVLWLNFELLFVNLYNMIFMHTKNAEMIIEEAYQLFKCVSSDLAIYTNAHFVWFLFEDYYMTLHTALSHYPIRDGLIDKINAQIISCLLDEKNVTFVDLKLLIAEIGIYNAFDNREKYRWNAPYSKNLIEVAVKEIHKQYLIEQGITKKCLVIDCDNVLWGGILSEDGIENLKLSGSGFGRLYQDFQRFVLSLYYHGVILAVCSKNDLPDVLTMFREHSEMILREEHIACFQVNWEDKPSNIKTIADKLNIGLDSMVFVDDSPVEIEAIKVLLPEVTTVLFHRDMDYAQFSCFNLKSDVKLEDIEKRNETYRTNTKRKELKEQSDSYEQYVKALEVKTEIHRIVPMEYSRVAELTQRTNKCTNGRRFTVQGIKDLIENGETDFYSVHVSDRFSDLGLVGAFAIKDNELELFSLSCRALGREIENAMLEYIVAKWKIESVDFYSTGKNDDLKNVLEEKIHSVFVE